VYPEQDALEEFVEVLQQFFSKADIVVEDNDGDDSASSDYYIFIQPEDVEY